jgi:hypothetical protein
VVIAEESGLLLDPEDTQRLEAAQRDVGVERPVAVSYDPLVVDDLVYELGVGAEDLDALPRECGGMNLLLIPPESVEVAVLCTVDDFRLVPGAASS